MRLYLRIAAFLLVLSACAPIAKPAVVPSVTEAPSLVDVDILANLRTPTCESGPTPAEQEGPYYLLDSPERYSLLEQGVEGQRVIITGYVVDKNCLPVFRARLDFWQADANGNYDLNGFALRGHQFTDNKGRYYLETILPGLYESRPIRHIHVKVESPDGQLLTTQLYFPDQAVDGLTVTLEQRDGYLLAIFHFILDL